MFSFIPIFLKFILSGVQCASFFNFVRMLTAVHSLHQHTHYPTRSLTHLPALSATLWQPFAQSRKTKQSRSTRTCIPTFSAYSSPAKLLTRLRVCTPLPYIYISFTPTTIHSSFCSCWNLRGHPLTARHSGTLKFHFVDTFFSSVPHLNCISGMKTTQNDFRRAHDMLYSLSLPFTIHFSADFTARYEGHVISHYRNVNTIVMRHWWKKMRSIFMQFNF